MLTEMTLAQRVERANLGSRAEQVVQLLDQLPQFASYASAREVAERAGVNVSTVVRTAQQLGFDGWPGLRKTVRAEYLDALATSGPARPATSDPVSQMLRRDAANLAALASASNHASIARIAEAIRTSRRTVVIATGSGAGPAHILCYLASFHGYDMHLATGPATTQAVAVSQLDERDCLIVLNVWRLTRDLRGLTRLGKERGATVAVLTDLQSSPLNSEADHVVITPIEGIGATPSLTAMVASVQAILADLENTTAPQAVGLIEQAWERLGLMEDGA